MEESKNIIKCLAITKNGKQCKKKALLNTDYCSIHQPNKLKKKEKLTQGEIIGIVIGVLGILISIYYGISVDNSDLKRLQNDILRIQDKQDILLSQLPNQDFSPKQTLITSSSRSLRMLTDSGNVNVEVEYDISPIGTSRSNFLLTPRIDIDSALIVTTKRKKLGFYYDPNKIINLFKGIPDSMITTLTINPNQEFSKWVKTTSGKDTFYSASNMILPLGAKLVRNKISWIPSYNKGGYADHFIMLTKKNAELTYRYSSKTKIGHDTMGVTVAFVATAFRVKINEVEEQIDCDFRPFQEQKSTYYLAYARLLITNNSNHAIIKKSGLTEITTQFYNFINNLSDKEVNLYEIKVGQKLKIKLKDENLNFLETPRGSVVHNKELQWEASDANLNKNQYIIVNNSKGILFSLSEDGKQKSYIDPSNYEDVPGLFTVYRIRVVK